MAYDTDLAERIRDALTPVPDVEEKAMFGGLAFLVRGHMTVAASGRGGLMVRADPDSAPGLVASTAAEFMEMQGRTMRGWLYVEAGDVESEDELTPWVEQAVAYAATLPAKPASATRARRPKR